MDGGRSGQVSIDVTDTFNDLIIIWYSWNQFICHRSSQFEQVNKKVQLLIAPKPSWTCSKEKKLFCDVGGLLASAFPWLQPLQLFSVGVGQTPSLKGQACVQWWLQDSSWRYHCADTGQIHQRNSTSCQDAVQGVSACRLRQFWALFDILVDLELVSII